MTDSVITAEPAPTEAANTTEPSPSEGTPQATEATVNAPENYNFKAPEGVTLDPTLVNEFVPLAKEMKLSQEQAQKLVDLQFKADKQKNEAQVRDWDNMLKGWVDNARADKEIGGVNFDANIAIARKPLEQYGTKELRELMDMTGAGNHPEMLRFMYRIGKAMSEDKVHVGGNPKGEARDPAKILFPSMN